MTREGSIIQQYGKQGTTHLSHSSEHYCGDTQGEREREDLGWEEEVGEGGEAGEEENKKRLRCGFLYVSSVPMITCNLCN